MRRPRFSRTPARTRIQSTVPCRSPQLARFPAGSEAARRCLPPRICSRAYFWEGRPCCGPMPQLLPHGGCRGRTLATHHRPLSQVRRPLVAEQLDGVMLASW